MSRYIDAEKINLPEGFFNKVDNVPKFFEWLDNLPTADVQEVRRGTWEVVDDAEPRRYGCSRCKCLSWTIDNYCSYCGARMDEGVQK